MPTAQNQKNVENVNKQEEYLCKVARLSTDCMRRIMRTAYTYNLHTRCHFVFARRFHTHAVDRVTTYYSLPLTKRRCIRVGHLVSFHY